jgi:hypothetical protein
MPPLAFTDEEIDLLSALASALPPSVRGAFLEIVSKKLGAYPPEAHGPGLLHRIATEAQRDFVLAGPVAVGTGGKHGRTHTSAARRGTGVT